MAGVKAGAALAAVVALAAIAPATAAADQRYASPGGAPVDACTQSDPCDFETAVEGAADGDEVIVEPGVHSPPGQVSLTTATVVHGAEGQPPPQIVSAAGTAISVTPTRRPCCAGSTSGTSAPATRCCSTTGWASGSPCRSTSAGFTCHVLGATLRDSICWATGPGGDAAPG